MHSRKPTRPAVPSPSRTVQPPRPSNSPTPSSRRRRAVQMWEPPRPVVTDDEAPTVRLARPAEPPRAPAKGTSPKSQDDVPTCVLPLPGRRKLRSALALGLGLSLFGSRALAAEGIEVGQVDVLSAAGDVGPNHYAPDAAFDGQGFQVVWSDNRRGCSTGSCDINTWQNEYDLYSRGVSLGGLAGSQVSTAVEAGTQNLPATAVTGSGVWAAWEDGRSGIQEIWAGPVSPTTLSAFRVSVAGDFSMTPALAFGGEHFLAVWRTSAGLHAARFDTLGKVLDQPPLVLDDMDFYGQPAVASDGQDFLVVWDRQSADPAHSVSAKRIRQSDGAVLDAEPIAVSVGLPPAYLAYTPSVAFDGQRYLVAYANASTTPGSGSNVHAMLVETDGTLTTGNAVTIRGGAGGQPDVAAIGPGFLVVWSESRPKVPGDNSWAAYGVYGMRLTGEGEVLDNGGVELSNDDSYEERSPRVAGGDGNYLVAWEHRLDVPMSWTPQAVAAVTLAVSMPTSGSGGAGGSGGSGSGGAAGAGSGGAGVGGAGTAGAAGEPAGGATGSGGGGIGGQTLGATGKSHPRGGGNDSCSLSASRQSTPSSAWATMVALALLLCRARGSSRKSRTNNPTSHLD